MSNEIDLIKTDPMSLTFERRKAVTAEKWHTFARRTKEDMWAIGRWLHAVKTNMSHGEWQPWLDQIGMSRQLAHKYMSLAEGYPDLPALLAFDGTADDAITAIPPDATKEQQRLERSVSRAKNTDDADAAQRAAKAAEKAAQNIKAAAKTKAEKEKAEAAEQAAAEAKEAAAAAAEAEKPDAATIAEAEADRKDARDERLAMRLEGSDLEAVEELSKQLDAGKAEVEKLRKSGEAHRKRANSEANKNRKVREFLLGTKGPNKAVDDCLAQFWNVARKQKGDAQ